MQENCLNLITFYFNFVIFNSFSIAYKKEDHIIIKEFVINS